MSSGAQEIPPAPRPVFALRAEKGAEPRSGPAEPAARPAPSHVGPGTRGAPAAGGNGATSPAARARCGSRSLCPPLLRPPPADGGAGVSRLGARCFCVWGGERLTPRSNFASGSAPSPLGVKPSILPRSGHREWDRPRGALLAGGVARGGGRRAAAAAFVWLRLPGGAVGCCSMERALGGLGRACRGPRLP